MQIRTTIITVVAIATTLQIIITVTLVAIIIVIVIKNNMYICDIQSDSKLDANGDHCGEYSVFAYSYKKTATNFYSKVSLPATFERFKLWRYINT